MEVRTDETLWNLLQRKHEELKKAEEKNNDLRKFIRELNVLVAELTATIHAGEHSGPFIVCSDPLCISNQITVEKINSYLKVPFG